MNTLLIQGENKIYQPMLKDEITWETERQGSPGKLTFNVVKDQGISFKEGNTVIFKTDDKNVFYGFIFSKSRDKEHHIKVVAYDQLRYFKNKTTLVYANKTADELIKIIARDFHLRTGTLESTRFKIANKIEDDCTLFDIVQNALDDTYLNGEGIFVLYDEFGYLALKNISSMKIHDAVIDSHSIENFDYKSTIDELTYNKIQIHRDNNQTGLREFFTIQDDENIAKWGVLQLTEEAASTENAYEKAKTILNLHNRVTRSLSIENMLGNTSVRAGCLIPVVLDLGDITVQNFMLAEKVTHTFKNQLHTMNLTLKNF